MNADDSNIKAAISAPTPPYGHPSSTVTNLWVFLTELTMDYLSNGLIVLKLRTSQLIPYYSNLAAASKQCFTPLA